MYIGLSMALYTISMLIGYVKASKGRAKCYMVNDDADE